MLQEQMTMPDDNPNAPPRKLTAIGTAGGVGQLFTVYEKNWKCAECNQENYATRPRCFRCRAHKPEGELNYVVDPALEALQGGQSIEWQEVIDPTSYQIYYYNKTTGATQWERPAEMGPAPHATGWFGRGKAGSTASQMYLDRNTKYLKRQARKQKEFIDPKKYHLEGAEEYNIWYGKYIGDNFDNGPKDPAESRCVLETDSGATKADIKTSKKDRRFFCVHFAKGGCAKGHECNFYHRIPTPEDDANCDELFDCFGRQRHSKHRDDMNGVGSFMKPCRTLFVGGLQKQKYETSEKLEEALWKHFGEWGELENINVIYRLSICFVRYRLRTSAEFAKEAMSNQALDQAEILSIRWAHDDPNPVAQDSIARADKDALFALLQAKGFTTRDAGFQYPAEYQLPDSKRMRLENGADILESHPQLAYPDTDGQYQASATAVAPGGDDSGLSAEQYQQWQQYYAAYYAQFQSTGSTTTPTTAGEAVATSASASAAVVDGVQEEASRTADDAEEGEVGKGKEWSEMVDESTGATYYYNNFTGESAWSLPAATAVTATASSTSAQE